MQSIILLALLTLIIQGCHMGSRMTASLFAIELGAMFGVAPVFWASAALLVTSGILSRDSN